jgi:hypothetical protein
LISGRFLAILDFDPGMPYKNDYKHHPGAYTFKEDYADYFIKKGYFLIAKESYINGCNEVGFEDYHDDRITIQLLQK